MLAPTWKHWCAPVLVSAPRGTLPTSTACSGPATGKAASHTAVAAADGSLSRQRSASTIMLSPARSEMGARSPWRMMMML